MKNLILILSFAIVAFSSCKKKEVALKETKNIKTYAVSISTIRNGGITDSSGYYLGINDQCVNCQTKLKFGIYILKTGDKLSVVNWGEDYYSNGTKIEGMTDLVVTIDNDTVYNVQNCYCDQSYTHIFE